MPKNRYDCAVLVSNDSDFAEALRLIKQEHNKTIGLIIPTQFQSSRSLELSKYATFTKVIYQSTLAASQLPNPIPGTNIRKPETW